MMDSSANIALGSAIVSVLALLLNLASLITGVVFAKKSALSASGAAETTLRSAIIATTESVSNPSLKIADFLGGKRPDQLLAAERRQFGIYASAFATAVENNLNAYEDACGKYHDRKIDRERFKKTYINEIKGICEVTEEQSEEIHNRMHPEGTSHFEAIWKVYREWHRHEK